MNRFSILNNLDKCYFCGKKAECIHEVFYGTANRKISIKNGFCVGLCNNHHNMTNNSVHYNRGKDLKLKKLYQKEYEKTHTRQEFITLIGKSYL
jgi:NADH:ubiquinone oxidoreductase subunit E